MCPIRSTYQPNLADFHEECVDLNTSRKRLYPPSPPLICEPDKHDTTTTKKSHSIESVHSSAAEGCQAHYKSWSWNLWSSKASEVLCWLGLKKKGPKPPTPCAESCDSGPSGCMNREPLSITSSTTHSLCSNIFHPSGAKKELWSLFDIYLPSCHAN